MAPDAGAALRASPRVAVIVRAKARQATPGGISYEAPDVAERIRARVTEALRESFARKGYAAVQATTPADDHDVDEATRLFEAVSGAVSTMHYPPLAPGGRALSYGLGSIGQVLDRLGADVLLEAWAYCASSTRTLGLRNPAVEGTVLYLGLVDRDGRLLYFHRSLKPGEALLADEDHTRRLVEGALSELPRGPR